MMLGPAARPAVQDAHASCEHSRIQPFVVVRRPARATFGCAPLFSNGMLMTRPLHVLGTNHLLELLPPEEKTRVTSIMERVDGDQGHVLYTPNTPISHVYFPLSGIIS